MTKDINTLEKYKNGREVNSEDNYILEKYRQTGLIKFRVKVKKSGNIIITLIASLTPLGKKYLYETKAKKSLIGKLFNQLFL